MGYAGDKAGSPMLVEQEIAGIRPNVGGVRGNEEREVADQAYPAIMGHSREVAPPG
jgi:hypothetical protein